MPGFLSNIALVKTYEKYNIWSSLVGDPKDRSTLQFINGLQDLGLWDKVICWPLRKDQNIGTGDVVHGIGGLGNFDGDLMLNASWDANGMVSNSCSSGYLKIANGVGLLSAEQVTSGAVFTSTNILSGDPNYFHYWIYGNQLGETDNIEDGGSFKEAAGKGLINNMRSAELSGAFKSSTISNGTYQFLINVNVTELTGNSKTFLNGVLKTTSDVPVYYLGNENDSLSSINLEENDSPFVLESPGPLNNLLLMCQDRITPLLQQDSTNIFVEFPFDNSYQAGRVVIPPGSEWNWDQTQCTSWDSTKSVGTNPITWDIEPNTGTLAFHFVIKDTALNYITIANIYELYRNTMGKQYTLPQVPPLSALSAIS